MASVEEFVSSEDHLDICTKEELTTAEHCGIEIGDKHLKHTTKAILKANLFEKYVLSKTAPFVTSVLPSFLLVLGLSFEHQKELLLLQIQPDEFKLKAEEEKELAMEKMCQQTDQVHAELGQCQLDLIKERRVLADGAAALPGEQSGNNFDVMGNLKLP